jgi:hypothetical protein
VQVVHEKVEAAVVDALAKAAEDRSSGNRRDNSSSSNGRGRDGSGSMGRHDSSGSEGEATEALTVAATPGGADGNKLLGSGSESADPRVGAMHTSLAQQVSIVAFTGRVVANLKGRLSNKPSRSQTVQALVVNGSEVEPLGDTLRGTLNPLSLDGATPVGSEGRDGSLSDLRLTSSLAETPRADLSTTLSKTHKQGSRDVAEAEQRPKLLRPLGSPIALRAASTIAPERSKGSSDSHSSSSLATRLPKDLYTPAVREALDEAGVVLKVIQKELLLLLEKDTLPRFKSSPLFLEYVEAEPLLFQVALPSRG